MLQLIQRHRQAALLDIHLFRRAEPQHVLSPFGHGFDVQQVLDAHIFGYGVAAPAAAAQGEGGGHFEIVQIADAALGGGGVHHDAAGLHPGREGIQHLGLLLGVGIQGRSVAVAAVGDQPVGLIEGVLQIFGAVHGQHGAQLFMSEFFGERHGFHFADQHLGALRHGNAGQRRDFAGALTHDFGVQRAVDQDGVAHLVQLCAFQEPAAAVRELGLDFIIDAVQHDHALLGGADHAVVKGFGMDDGIDRQHQVGAVVDDSGHVARAHAQGWLAAGIGSLHHAGAAGGQDNIRFPHQGVGHVQGRHVDPADDALRRAGLHRCVQHHLRRGDGSFLGPGMGAENDAVAGFQADQRLENGGGGGVGGGDHRRHHADGLGNFLHAVSLVFLDDAAGLGIPIGVVNVFAGVVILDHLVLHHAHAGFLHSQLGQGMRAWLAAVAAARKILSTCSWV